jgi:hypothetical protein
MSYIQAERDFRLICKTLGFDRVEICSDSRKAHLVEKRKIIAEKLDALNYNPSMISHVMDKDRTTILYYLGKLKGKKND